MTRTWVYRLTLFAMLSLSAVANGQSISRVTVKNTGCTYTVGAQSIPCSLAPGMTVIITGSDFGQPGNVSLCDCGPARIKQWGPNTIIFQVEYVTPDAAIAVETITGAWSNPVPYVALAPVITSIKVGNCTFVVNQSANQCVIFPGAQITIHGNYFGRGGQVATCDCSSATIISWNPNWATNPTAYGNTIVATATGVAVGSTVSVQVMALWSNPVPYTSESCGL